MRVNKLQKLLTRWDVDGCLVQNPIDLFYLLGLSLSSGSLLVSQKRALLFVDSRYIQMAQAATDAALSTEKAHLDFLKQERVKRLAFDSAWTSYDTYLKWKQRARLSPQPHLVAPLRLIKDAQERRCLQESAALLQKGMKHIRTKLVAGITESELALEFELFCKKKGAQGLAFEPIIAFGENSAMPHHRAGTRLLKRGDVVLLDVGVVFKNYHSDMTRVYFFGTPDRHLKRMDAVVKEAQEAAIALCKPGQTVGALDQAARAVMHREGVEEYFIHSLGHGIGLETHESPRLKFGGEESATKLKPGMVITIEPGLYFSGKGGVRHEDMVLITEKGHKKITTC